MVLSDTVGAILTKKKKKIFFTCFSLVFCADFNDIFCFINLKESCPILKKTDFTLFMTHINKNVCDVNLQEKKHFFCFN